MHHLIRLRVPIETRRAEEGTYTKMIDHGNINDLYCIVLHWLVKSRV